MGRKQWAHIHVGEQMRHFCFRLDSNPGGFYATTSPLNQLDYLNRSFPSHSLFPLSSFCISRKIGYPKMGKYMKKSKIIGDGVGVMDSTEPTSLGVRTRAAAKTLALKRLNSSASDSALAGDSSCYLQLRSRRLEKPLSLAEPKQPPPPRHHKSGVKESGSRARVDSNAAGSGSVHVAHSCNGDECFGNSVTAEAFCGENSLDFESRHSTRESTPCNFVEDLEIIVTPGSSTRSMRTATKDYTRERDITVPTTSELEEFFAYAEQQQQRLFMDKYNFDIVNDIPLNGRYEWVQVTP